MTKVVLSTEKTRILNTKEYALFTLNDTLSISTKHLNKIKDSISEKNLCKDYPILVNDKYEVLEGKYRFLACYDLRLPIFYKISEVTTFNDAIALKHINRKVPFEDIINVYRNNPNYGNLLEMFREYDEVISLKHILQTIQWDFKRLDSDFYSGKLKDWSVESFREKADRVLYIMKFFEVKHYKDALGACIKYFGITDSTNKFSQYQMLLIYKLVRYKESIIKHVYQVLGDCASKVEDMFSKDQISELNETDTVDIDTYNEYLAVGVKLKKKVARWNKFEQIFEVVNPESL